MFQPSHRIRWKRSVAVEVLTDWCQDTGLSWARIAGREAGQEGDVWYSERGDWPTVQVHLAEPCTSSDSTRGRMQSEVPGADFDMIRTHSWPAVVGQ